MIVLERVGIGDAHQVEAGNLDVVVVEVGQVAHPGEVLRLAQVGSLPPPLDHLAVAAPLAPESLRGAFRDGDDGGVVGERLPRIGLGPVTVELRAPLLLAADHFAHDALARILVGHHDLLQLHGGGLQGEVLPGIGGNGDRPLLAVVADIAHQHRGGQLPDGELVFAVGVGDGALVGALHQDIGRGQGLARLGVGDGAVQGDLGGCARDEGQEEEYDEAGTSEQMHALSLRGSEFKIRFTAPKA